MLHSHVIQLSKNICGQQIGQVGQLKETRKLACHANHLVSGVAGVSQPRGDKELKILFHLFAKQIGVHALIWTEHGRKLGLDKLMCRVTRLPQPMQRTTQSKNVGLMIVMTLTCR